jgi:hypothetical protein
MPDDHDPHVPGDPETIEILFCTPFAIEVRYPGRPEPVYWSREEYLKYRLGTDPRATRRQVYAELEGILTCPEDLKQHAATRGLHVGQHPGPRSKRSKGELLDGQRYLQLRAEGHSDSKIAELENERRQRTNDRAHITVDEDLVHTSIRYARSRK